MCVVAIVVSDRFSLTLFLSLGKENINLICEAVIWKGTRS